MTMLEIHFGDNLSVLEGLPDASFDLIYIDPPFNTGKVQARTRTRTVRDQDGDRTGFSGHRYRTEVLGKKQYADTFDDYLAFLEPRLVEARRVLAPEGSIFVHLNKQGGKYQQGGYSTVEAASIAGAETHYVS